MERGELEKITELFKNDPWVEKELRERERKLEKFKNLFRVENLDNLSKEEFESFLRDNGSWSNLYRQGLKATEDMDLLKESLRHLQNEEVEIGDRLRNVTEDDESDYYVHGIGQNIATAIIFLCDENDRYGILNNRVVRAFQELELFPEDRPSSIEYRYEVVNTELNNLKDYGLANLQEVDLFVYWFDEKMPTSLNKGALHAVENRKQNEERINKHAEFEEEAKEIVEDNLGNLDKDQIKRFLETINTGYWGGEEHTDGRFRQAFTGNNKKLILDMDISKLNSLFSEIYQNENLDVDKPSGVGQTFVSALLYLKDRDKYNFKTDILVRGIRTVFSDVDLGDSFEEKYYTYNRYVNRVKLEAYLRPQEVDSVLTELGRSEVYLCPGSEENVKLSGGVVNKRFPRSYSKTDYR